MAELRALCVSLGFEHTATFIASGNVIFPRAAPDSGALEAAIVERFGVETVAIMRTAAQLRSLVDAKPFGSRAPDAFVAFLARKPAKANFEALSTSDFPDEAWERVGQDLALLYPSSFHRAKLTGARLERLLNTEATLRNWRTVTKLAELAAG
jgi:uncharacterized protein (DUF1697 family)